MYIFRKMLHTNKKTKEGAGMEEARKKLRFCLVLIVAAAIIVGLIYYFSDVKGSSDMSEGTLVKAKCNVIGTEADKTGGSYGIGE